MVKIAIIGTGNMGFNHVRVLTSIEGVERISICDANKERLEQVARRFNIAQTYTDFQELLKKEKPDGVIIATPSATHKKLVSECLKHDIAILCEKPLADTVADAQAIAKEVENKKGAKVLVGHIERFNPVVAKMKELTDQGLLGRPYYVQTRRNGPFPKRLYGLKSGVLIDLAVHDVDIIEYLVAPIEQVYAQLITEKEQEIHATALLNLKNGVRGSCEFSWISPKRIRTIEIYGTKGILFGDYQNQEVWFYENAESNEIQATDYFKQVALAGHVSEGKVIKYPVKKDEPLFLEQQEFVEIVRGKKKPSADVQAGVRAVLIAQAILKSGKKNELITI